MLGSIRTIASEKQHRQLLCSLQRLPSLARPSTEFKSRDFPRFSGMSPTLHIYESAPPHQTYFSPTPSGSPATFCAPLSAPPGALGIAHYLGVGYWSDRRCLHSDFSMARANVRDSTTTTARLQDGNGLVERKPSQISRFDTWVRTHG